MIPALQPGRNVGHFFDRSQERSAVVFGKTAFARISPTFCWERVCRFARQRALSATYPNAAVRLFHSVPKKQRAPSNVEVLGALSKREKETTMRSKRLILILCLLGALSLNASVEVNIHIDFALEASVMFALYALSRRR